MNYQKHYDQLIKTRKLLNREKTKELYFEKHHIVPKCLGGSNDKSNLVLLTAREHFLAHRLLWKATKLYNLACAFNAMAWHNKDKRKYTAKQYEYARLALSEAKKTYIFTEEHKKNLSKSAKGKMHSKEHVEKVAAANRGRKHTEEAKRKIKEKRSQQIYTEETKKKMSDALKKRRANYPLSPETITKQVLANTGQKRTEETKAKMREAWEKRKLISVSEETKQKISEAQKGKVFSEEHKRKLSQAAKEREARKKLKLIS